MTFFVCFNVPLLLAGYNLWSLMHELCYYVFVCGLLDPSMCLLCSFTKLRALFVWTHTVSMPSTSNGDIANPIPSSSTSKPGLQLVMAASSIPHPKKASFGGEDAYFIDHDALAMGVADGVGGWSQDGVTSKEYAMQFMQKCNVHLPIPATEDANSKYPYDGLRQSLQMAHNEVNIPGSTTVCILQVDPWTSILHAANVGDSGFRVIRSGEVVCSSNIQEVTWNMPFQFGSPNHLPDTNVADDADLLTFELQVRDSSMLLNVEERIASLVS